MIDMPYNQTKLSLKYTALSAGAVEYADCTSVKGYAPPPMRPPFGRGWQPVRRDNGIQLVEQSLIRQPNGQ